MARKAVATAETVAAAVEGLLTEKLDPTVERVRAKLGGGSFTTISRLLSDALAQRRGEATAVSEVPADLAEIGQRAVAAIYAAVQRVANAKIEAIEADARSQIERAQQARAEAALEIERLEREAEAASEALSAAQTALQEARVRAERAEAQLSDVRQESQKLAEQQEAWRTRVAETSALAETRARSLERADSELERLRSETQRARDEAAELRGELKALEGKGRK